MRRIVVTGANKGIGKAIAQAIVDEHDDTQVFLGSRDLGRGRAAAADIGSDRVHVLQLDVGDDASVAAAVEAVGGPIHALVNNAGVYTGDTVGVNTLGLKRVTEAFLPFIQARIVNVSSASGPMFLAGQPGEVVRRFTNPVITRSEFDQLVVDGPSFGGNPYGLSKALVNAYTQLLVNENPSLLINACTPGFIETDLTRPFAAGSGKTPAEMGMKQPADGARCPLHLLFGELDGNGWYYGSDAVRSPLDRYRSPGDPPYRG